MYYPLVMGFIRGTSRRLGPHPLIVTTKSKGNYTRASMDSWYINFSGRGPNPKHHVLASTAKTHYKVVLRKTSRGQLRPGKPFMNFIYTL